jgi:hypothetical protein
MVPEKKPNKWTDTLEGKFARNIRRISIKYEKKRDGCKTTTRGTVQFFGPAWEPSKQKQQTTV